MSTSTIRSPSRKPQRKPGRARTVASRELPRRRKPPTRKRELTAEERAAEWRANFVPTTPLAKKLWALRLKIEEVGGANLTIEDVLKRLRKFRE